MHPESISRAQGHDSRDIDRAKLVPATGLRVETAERFQNDAPREVLAHSPPFCGVIGNRQNFDVKGEVRFELREG